MRTLGQVALVQDQQVNVSLDANVAGLILVNESLFSVNVTVAGINRWLPAWTADLFDFSDTPVSGGQASLVPRYITNLTNPPSAAVLPTAVYVGDKVSGTYPYALSRQTSSSVVASSSFALLAPDGLAEFFADDTSFANILALLPANVPSSNALLDIMLAAKLNGSTDRVVLQSDVANNALLLKMALKLQLNTGMSLSGVQVLTGTGQATGIAHSLGVTPQFAVASPTNSAVACSVQNYSPTTVDLVIAGGGVGVSWKILLVA